MSADFTEMPLSHCGRGRTVQKGWKRSCAGNESPTSTPAFASSMPMVFILMESFPGERNPAFLTSPANPSCCFLLPLMFCFRLFIAMWAFFPTVQCIRSCPQTVIFSLCWFFFSFYLLLSLSHSPAMLSQLNFCRCL